MSKPQACFFETSTICILIEWSVMSLQGQRQNRSKGGFSRRKAWDTSENHVTNRRSFLVLWQDPQRTSFKWQVFPSKLLPSKPEVKEESKARGKKHGCNHELQKPVVDCGSQVKREDVKVKKEIKELPPQKIKTFRWGTPMVVEDVDFSTSSNIIWSFKTWGLQAKQIDRLQHLRLGEIMKSVVVGVTDHTRCWSFFFCRNDRLDRVFTLLYSKMMFRDLGIAKFCHCKKPILMRRNVTKECCRIKPRTSWRFCRSSWWFCTWPQGFSLETTACWITRCGWRIHAKVWERDSLIRAMQWLYCADSAADAQQRFHLSPWSADEEAGTVRGLITMLTCWDTDSSCQVKLYFFLFNANICKE